MFSLSKNFFKSKFINYSEAWIPNWVSTLTNCIFVTCPLFVMSKSWNIGFKLRRLIVITYRYSLMIHEICSSSS